MSKRKEVEYLKIYLEENERTASWLARKVNVSPTAVHYWLQNKTKPTMKQKIKITSITGIQWN